MLANLTVNLSDDPDVNRHLTAVVRSAVEEFITIFPACPPAGERPIHVSYRSDGPFNDSTKDPNIYSIYLTVSSRAYCQLVFQLGHELCHIVSDPRRTNWFVESCCEMVSLVLLRQMTRVWDCTPPAVPDGVKYTPEFEKYAEDWIRKATMKIFQSESLPEQAEVRNWLASVKSSFQACPLWRERNVLIAEMLHPFFQESMDNWYALYFLGQACDSPPIDLRDPNLYSSFEFDRWLEAVPEHLKDFVRRIRDIFENETPPKNG